MYTYYTSFSCQFGLTHQSAKLRKKVPSSTFLNISTRARSAAALTLNMDHEGEDSGFNLYEHYGTGMGDVVGGGGEDDTVGVSGAAAFPMHGWDHHVSAADEGDGGVYPDLTGEGYTHLDTKMTDFDTTQYTHEFQQSHPPFEGDPQEFQNYLVQHQGIGDQHDQDQHQHQHQQHHQAGTESGYDIHSMELYHTPTIYPTLAQTQESHQQQQYGTYTQIDLFRCHIFHLTSFLRRSDVCS